MGFTAILAGGIGAAGSIGSALIGSNASQNASNQQVAMQRQALAQQQALFNQGSGQQMNLFNQGLGTQANYFDQAQTAFGTAQKALSPYATAGQGALSQLQGLLTPGTSAASLAQMPGFQFASQYGTMAATNALSGKTGASAGPLATAVSQYNNGLASQQYQNIVGNLQNFAGLGATAAGGIANAANTFGGIAGNAGNAAFGGAVNTGNAILGAGVNAGNSQAGTLGNIGNAQASGTLGSANALSGGLTGAANAGSNALLYSQLFGGGGNNGGGLYSGASYGGGNAFTDAYGGSASNPLAGLSASDYG